MSTAKYGGDWHSLLHTHACTELFYVVGGMGQFNIADRLLPVSTDDLVIVNPNVEHTELSLNASPLEYIVLGVEGLEFEPAEDGDDRYALVNFRGGGEEMLFYLRAMLREIETKAEGYQVVCQDLLEVLLVRLMRRTNFTLSVAPTGRRTSKECAAVRRYIDSHFKESINLELLSQLTHVNKYYMVHAFSREYGISPINYLISRRIQESRYLLSTTDHSLSQIAHMLGFSSPSYFSQSFRKLSGMSPMEYRKQQRSGSRSQSEP
ncbi:MULTISPECIES: AraC family transcriptional regulator [Intestinimonas]|uniref:AraC family transcriptional regulator n=1 Tax=Intestinimonas TaxID=1392389 RepID=UPI001FA6BFF6|nr:AraC family transcriptional regulator [Intestinimonas massiliensis (ex Afouda et al. 2020)]MCI5563975.1 AraC family transcriptional regulator [Intestinimonas massiliensis (ex Afouda et al. 2020)]